MNNVTREPRVLLTTMTAKYIHSSLSLRYLFEACRELPIKLEMREYHINMPLMSILGSIDEMNPDVVGFSCYIWNISLTLELVRMLKSIRPHCIVVLGGPEVSYDSADILTQNPDVDFIISGEGDEAFPALLASILRLRTEGDGDVSESGELSLPAAGLTYRDGGEVVSSGAAFADLCSVQDPYGPIGLQNLENKLVYVESSRGCPFSCQYCLSSRSKAVRYFPLETVKDQIQKLVDLGCGQIKFVDRTFNCHKSRALELWRYMRDLATDSVFHFEIAADILDEEMMEFLETVPAGRFQFEIGVQTTNPASLTAIHRNQGWDKLSAMVRRLMATGNIEVHLDLIAGLPGDSFESFTQSINDVYQLNPTRIQLGFLKLLKGSGLWQSARELGLICQSSPPYEILRTPDMSFADLTAFKRIDELIESYYNSRRFDMTLKTMVGTLYEGHAASFLFQLSDFWRERQLFGMGHKHSSLYDILSGFILSQHRKDSRFLHAVLLGDFVSREPRRDLPAWSQGSQAELKYSARDQYHQMISDEKWREQYVPHLLGLPNREVDKQIRVVQIDADLCSHRVSPSHGLWYVFDYSRTNPITERATMQLLDLKQ